MQAFVAKTFGGLLPQYYFRQLVFGLVFPVFIGFMLSRSAKPVPFALIALAILNTLLYPYARFVYEGVVSFILGRNVFYVNVLLMIYFKLMAMLMCWSLAIFIAPPGLLYLYFHHSKLEQLRG